MVNVLLAVWAPLGSPDSGGGGTLGVLVSNGSRLLSRTGLPQDPGHPVLPGTFSEHRRTPHDRDAPVPRPTLGDEGPTGVASPLFRNRAQTTTTPCRRPL